MKIVKEFILRNIAGECVLVPTGATTQEFNGLITMSDTAKFIWENIEKAESFGELVKMMLEEYEIDEETAKKDAYVFIDQLLANGFVECSKEDRSW
ncbi:MAG: PqqD family protein [Schaedlerella sp.]|nr:PqqD family protein [Schaedlerella sp.]